jgi:hypothetical protein
VKKLLDDCLKADGNWSVPKIAAAFAHFNMAIAFVWITYTVGFLWDLWLIYGGVAIFHRIVDKTGEQITEFKNKQLTSPPPQ